MSTHLTPEDRALIQRALCHYSGIVGGSERLSVKEVVDEMFAIRIAQDHLSHDQVEVQD